jgi:hypothetical protein
MDKAFFIVFMGLFLSCPSRASDIQSFLDLVEKKNLEIQVQQEILEAAALKSEGLHLPAPMIGISQMRNLQGTSYAFEVQQSLPLSSQLFDEKKMREESSILQQKKSAYFTSVTLFEARLAYVSYWASYEKLKLLEDLRKWLDHHLSYARSLSRSDTELKLHTLEIESLIGIYDNEISAFKNTLEEKKVKLRTYAYDAKFDPETPSMDPVKKFSEKDGLSRISEIDRGKLKVAMEELEVARNSGLPNLYLKFKKLDRPMMGMANQEIMVGIDLPFAWFWKVRAEKAEASSQKSLASARYQKSLVESEAMKSSLKTQASLLQDQLRNLDTVSIPAADKRLKLLKNLRPRNMSGLDSHHKVFHDAIRLKSQRIDVRLRYEEIYTKWMVLFGEA